MSAASDIHRSSSLGARRSRSLASARRRSQLILVLRLALLALIAAVVLNAAIQLIQQGLAGGNEVSFAPTTGSQRIVNPRFVGRDEGGAPFVVTADSAVRRQGGIAGVADLERPSLDYRFIGTDDTSQVLAETGVFDDTAQSLELGGEVSLVTESGYRFDTEAALIRLREGEISGEVPVFGSAPWGAVRADSFEVYDDGRRIVLSGDVRTRLYMTPAEESQP
jgi:lipopolysaccharide export system protein LptC